MEKKTKKLQLNKETVAVLNNEKMTRVRGGLAQACMVDVECPDGLMCIDGFCVECFDTLQKTKCKDCGPIVINPTLYNTCPGPGGNCHTIPSNCPTCIFVC